MAAKRPFHRLAIVNRGEPAMRLINAVRELNEQGGEPIRLIALYTDADRHALFVRSADESFRLGPSTFVDPEGARQAGYLDYEALERALRETRAEAAWVGWGFVAEHPRFSELCERLDVVMIGPDAETMRLLGDKISSKRLAERAGVPVAPWSGPVEGLEQAQRDAERIGYPLMVKASAGGGGRGIRRVDDAGELPEAFERARSEALQAFGDATVLLERLVTPARHIEVQTIADGSGGAWAAGVRDCSLQRRNQKVIEESGSTALDETQEREIGAAGRRLVLEAGYSGAATVEFLYELESRSFSFMEVNARLQVEHPVTEAVTGLDLVKLQLHVAAGGRLEGEPPPASGHAIEARLNAEDPARDFAPAPGRVSFLRLPSGPGVRVDSGLVAGDTIPPEFDSMVAKVIATGRDRAEAITRLRRALLQTSVVIDGGTTNRSFLLDLLAHPDVRAGRFDTTWLDRMRTDAGHVRAPHADAALLQAAIETHDEAEATDRARFYAFARRGRPQARAEAGRKIELRYEGESYSFVVHQLDTGRYLAAIDDAAVELTVERLSEQERRIEIGERSFRTAIWRQGADLLVEVDGVPHRVSHDEGGAVRSPAPGVVVSVPVAAGEEVEAGDVVVVLESMKMENSLVAPQAGRVREILVGRNVQVDVGTPLVEIEPREGESPVAAGGERVRFEAAEAPAASPAEEGTEALRLLASATMGYDVPERIVDGAIAKLGELAAYDGDLETLLAGEDRLLRLFADLRALTRPRHDSDDPARVLLRSPQEYFHSFLRSLDAESEGLPAHFVELLTRALAHYGVHDLDRTNELEEACYRLFLSQQRLRPQHAAVLAILDRRLECADEVAGLIPEDFPETLGQLAVATEGRAPAIADLVRQVRYRLLDEPAIVAAREAAYEDAGRHLDALAADPSGPDRENLVRRLVGCSQALAGPISRRLSSAEPAVARALLEVVARRYYRMRDLSAFSEQSAGGFDFIRSDYREPGGGKVLAAAFLRLDELESAIAAVAALAEDPEDGEGVAADLYAEYDGPLPSHEDLAARLAAALEAAQPPRALERVVLAVSDPERGRGMGAVDVFSFIRGEDGGLAEDESIRGLHPMMAERLHLWRLSRFELERRPSPEDVYLYQGTAIETPEDQRLFALAEVRALTPVRDEAGRVIGLPELERALEDSLEAMREAQAERDPRRRLFWNRVQMYVWPVMDVPPEDFRAIVRRYGRVTRDLGVEMVEVRGRMRDDFEERPRELRFFSPTGRGVVVEVDDPPNRPLKPLDAGGRRIIRARQRGTVHPAELVKVLAPARDDSAEGGLPPGEFIEHDLDESGRLAPVDRAPALNEASIVAGLVRNRTDTHPEGMLRVALFGDPTRALGSLAEPECKRIIAALDLAEELQVPAEWFALSAGAVIAMDSGTENMDWIAAVLRRIITFTQGGGELNIVVTGINVGAQPYWNSEATMLMHTRGILVMTPESAMVLTGKQALDYSGGVSAEDNFGIGGYERVMGPNGQAQYWAPDLTGACRLLLDHYEHTYVAPGERFPRRAESGDPSDRDVRSSPHRAPGSDLERVGDVFSEVENPGRKKPFDIRSVMRAVADSDRDPLERWSGWRDAETAVVWDVHLGGRPVEMLGMESRPLARHGAIPADGPEAWTSGTLFPQSSRKIARAINAASGNRPVVVIANLAGFDGAPESMAKWQLEYGAEIGRAVVNFRGPIVFCVVSRYHGGAFVVFSQRLNEELETVALEGAHASVIGGAPAAAVVFAGDVRRRAREDPRIKEMDERIERAEGAERQALRSEREELWEQVHSEKLGELAAEFDAVHSVERAVEVGSVSRIIPAASLRPYLIEAVERGIQRTEERIANGGDGARLADTLTG
jgi:acetyl/propionyl-CoA carboxylase alpha subunit/acetyl-CoA carboxylase carboxyltransferase component